MASMNKRKYARLVVAALNVLPVAGDLSDDAYLGEMTGAAFKQNQAIVELGEEVKFYIKRADGGFEEIGLDDIDDTGVYRTYVLVAEPGKFTITGSGAELTVTR